MTTTRPTRGMPKPPTDKQRQQALATTYRIILAAAERAERAGDSPNRSNGNGQS